MKLGRLIISIFAIFSGNPSYAQCEVEYKPSRYYTYSNDYSPTSPFVAPFFYFVENGIHYRCDNIFGLWEYQDIIKDSSNMINVSHVKQPPFSNFGYHPYIKNDTIFYSYPKMNNGGKSIIKYVARLNVELSNHKFSGLSNTIIGEFSTKCINLDSLLIVNNSQIHCYIFREQSGNSIKDVWLNRDDLVPVMEVIYRPGKLDAIDVIYKLLAIHLASKMASRQIIPVDYRD